MKHWSLSLLIVLIFATTLASSSPIEHQVMSGDQVGIGLVLAVDWSPDGKLLAYGSTAAGANVANHSGNPEVINLRNQIGPIFAIDWNHNGTLLATAAADLTIIVWNVFENDEKAEFMADSTNITAVSFNNDSSLLASSGSDGVKIWNPNSGDLITSFGPADVTDVEFHPAKQHVVYAYENKSVIWDYGTESEKIVMNNHQANITAAKWNANGSLFATSSLDKTVKIWNEGGNLLNTLNYSAEVLDFSWDPDSNRIAAVTADGVVHAKDIATENTVLYLDFVNDFKDLGLPRVVSWNSLNTKIAVGVSFEFTFSLDIDEDDDGLLTIEEMDLLTNPRDPDTDDDGLKDGQEIEFGYDPLNNDSNGDGILDGDDYFSPPSSEESSETTSSTQTNYPSILLVVVALTIMSKKHLIRF